jgi:hypothetical protein
VSTTSVTDSTTRIISSRDLDWSALVIGGHPCIPVKVTAGYHGSADSGAFRYYISAHVECRVIGASGRPTTKYTSAVFDSHMVINDEWPDWLRIWVDLYHPDRGGPDNDPTGSYL